MSTIRNNKFRIVLYALEVYSLIGGEFHVTDRSITAGQPTEIKKGDTLRFDGNGEFNFRVGRNKSKVVTDWFNAQCGATRCTTFGRRATSDMNFAFIGTLRLTVSYKRKKLYTVVLDDILIGQESNETMNNWWFGGKTCYKISERAAVESRGTALENNDNFRLTFLREGHTNVVAITNISYLSWMKNIDNGKLLSEINIPGTHDSGTYNFSNPLESDHLKTQNLTIRQQLDLGIRYLDIRCRHVNDTFQIYHGKYYVNINFDDVLEQCISFLNENESEGIVMLVSEETHPKWSSRAFYETFLDYVAKTSEYWFRGRAIPTVKDARKRISLMYRFNFENNSFGIDAVNWRANTTFDIKHRAFTLAIQDEYDVSYEDKARSIRAMADSSKERKYRHWYLNYISLAASSARGSVIKTSTYTNKIIHKIATTERSSFLGLVIMDYPENQKWLTSDIIENNDYF